MREPLIAPYLKSGELVKIFAAAIDDGRDYYLCVRQDSEMTPTASSYRAGCVSRPLGDLHLRIYLIQLTLCPVAVVIEQGRLDNPPK